MREIKFRAKIKGDAGVYQVWTIDWLWQKALISRACGDEWVAFEKIEAFLEYTGLRDSQSVEIYEGDMVRLDNRVIGGSVTEGEVMFNQDPTLSGLEWGIWTKRGYHRTDFLGTLEVIGNI